MPCTPCIEHLMVLFQFMTHYLYCLIKNVMSNMYTYTIFMFYTHVYTWA